MRCSQTSGTIEQDTNGPTRGRWGGSRRGRRERGTVLLMVVGVLALLSIIAVAYVSIGQADRRGAGVLVRAARLDDQRDAIAGYINRILVKDLFSTMLDPVVPATGPNPGTGVYRRIRAAWDYPSNSPLRRLDRTRINFTTPDPAPGAALDQWLVVSRIQTGSPDAQRHVLFNPEGHGDNPWLASAAPSAIPMATPPATFPHPANQAYLDIDGWKVITNIAPNGQFVNLGTLRPTTQNPRGNFFAASGVAPAGPANAADPAQRSAQMSYGLSLFDPATGQLFTNLNSVDLANGDPADRNIPAHWSTDQCFLFRPANELASTGAGVVGPESLLYLPYQFADADGDGFFDSRWFELSNGSNGEAAIPGLSFSGPARLFCAARIIDLSGRVNVNTASDFRGDPLGAFWGGPEQNFVAGVFPSDIDLGRLLRQADALDAYGAGYDDILHRIPGTAAATPTPLSDYGTYDPATAENEGRVAFDNIWQNNLVGYANPAPLPALDRAGAYVNFGKDPGGARFHAEVAAGNNDQYTLGTPFDNGDLAELLTRHGLNDPAFTSRLETLVDGVTGPAAGADPRGPMRSNRPLSLELNYRTANGPNGNTLATDGRPHETALLQLSSDIRAMLTTISGHRPILAGDVSGSPSAGNRIDAPDTAVNLGAVLRNAASPDPNVSGPARRRLFLAYADALMPAVPRENPTSVPGGFLHDEAWNPNGPLFEQLQTQFYGWRGPELALRMAAHMAANLVDMSDRPSGAASPGSDKQTGLIVYTQRNSLTTVSPPTGYTEVNMPDAESEAGIPDRERLAPLTVAATLPSSIRAYGTEAQPFITQVATYTMMTDAPYSGTSTPPTSEQDENWRWIDANGNGRVDPASQDIGTRYGEVTIDGSISASNRDFLFQVVAFQLHNPFNYDVSLSAHTLQFGSSRFPLPAGAVLAAGETRTFYATNPTSEPEINSRWSRVATFGAAGTLPQFKTWLDRQLSLTGAVGGGGGPGSATKLTGRRTLAGVAVPDTDVLDLLADRSSQNNLANFVALLWRSLDGSATVPPPGAVNNDLLVDRLRDPNIPDNLTSVGGVRATLDRRMDPGRTVIVGTSAGPDPRLGTPSNPAEARDNTGFSITLWGSVRRAGDPGANPAAPTIPRGALGAYCLEVKDQAGGTPGVRWGSLNQAETEGVQNLSAPEEAEFRNYGSDTFNALLGTQVNTALVDGMTREPKNKTGATARTSGDPSGPIDPIANPRRPYQNIYPEIHLKNDWFRATADFDGPGTPPNLPNSTYTTMRIGDTLLPMAIGAWWEPQAGAVAPANDPPGYGYADLARIDAEWTTLSEALALAMDYDTPRERYTGDPRPRLYRRFGRDIVDRGHLKLDRFVPFYNAGPALQDVELGILASAPTDPASVVTFPGIPLALTVLEQFRALEYGGEAAKINGTVNLNTAVLNVLRTLPMLTPEKTSWMTNSLMATAPGGVNATALYDPTVEHYDVAATLAAYRDKAAVNTRSTGAAGGTATYAIDFRDTATPPTATTSGRYLQTSIPGIREEAGLRSVGEVLCAALRPAAGALDDDAGRIDNSIDRFARRFSGTNINDKFFFDTRAGGTPDPLTGLDTCAYKTGALGTLDAPDQIPGDWDKNLTIANAVLNSVSVRSDVFCVYFVVQGYLPSDVEGFSTDPNDATYRQAMVPSIHRRFMMVVDRSNVQSTGDKPRILLLREVPL